MNKLFAAIIIASAFGLTGTSANAGIFTDIVKSQTSAIFKNQGSSAPAIQRQPKPAPGSLTYLGNKPYMDCLRGHYIFAKNDDQRRIASNICTQRYYY
jgi:hypothetical protein